MRAFIKDIRTFETTAHELVLDYKLVKSIYDAYSTVIISTPPTIPKEGDIIYIDSGYYGLIQSVYVDRGKTELSCSQIINLFGRKMFYTAQSFTYLEDYLAQLITDNFINCPDAFYALPYLQVNATTHTTSAMNPDLTEGVYSVKSYAAKMRRLYNIFCDWSLSRTALTLNISQKAPTVKNIDFSNPAYYLTAQDFSASTISKITTLCEEDSSQQDWVLLESGDIVNDAPAAGRKSGEWTTLIVKESANVADNVKDKFLSNEYSHHIEFSAPVSAGFNLYDRLNIKLDNKIFSSYVAEITTEKNSTRATITCGELQMQYPYLDLI